MCLCSLLFVDEDVAAPLLFFFFQAEDGIRDVAVTGVQTCALPICAALVRASPCRYRSPDTRVPSPRLRSRRAPPRRGAWPNRSCPNPSARSARDRKSTRLNSSHGYISYAVFCFKKKKIQRGAVGYC